MSEPKWYVARVMNAHTKSASAELDALGLPFYVPQETVDRRLGREVRQIKRPVWPGYVFIQCSEADMPAVGMIEGVTGFVRAHAVIDVRGVPTEVYWPVALRDNDLSPIMQAEIMGELDFTRAAKEAREPRSKIEEGDRVKVRSGKWKGYLARVIATAKRKIVVETDWCKMEFKPEELELASAA